MKIVIVFLMLCLCGCVKEKSCENCIPSHKPSIAGTVIYTGPIAGDGCEWCIVIDGVNYSPDNLNSTFQQTDLPVIVTYKLTGQSFGCGIGNIQLPIIHLTSINKV
ncbi:hypothetical protein BH10BAC3_BH10BAC3_00140 [soil metagenome]